MGLAGHFWTIGPSLRHDYWPRNAPSAEGWSTVLKDTHAGDVTLRGLLRAPADQRSTACVIVVHGLGGGADTFYCVQAAWAAERLGLGCLRLYLRGADRKGDDFYHAGLTADLEAAIASKALERFQRLYILGYSLGGHVSLRYGLAPSDPRVRALAAICPPLDLELSAQAIDRARAMVYRRHILSGLKEIYREVAAIKPVPTPLRRVRSARTIREWDSLTVVPRYGFGSVEQYYDQMSVGPRLSQLELPTLLVQSTADPMVPPWSYEQHLSRPMKRLDVRRLAAGGHVGFPASIRMGEGNTVSQGLEDQVMEWFLRQE